jgi:hypothetical protein
MTCKHCGGLVIWSGLYSGFPYTRCLRCKATNSAVPEPDPDYETETYETDFDDNDNDTP